MPQLLNTFPTSAAAGEGFESQYVEKFFLEAEGIVPIGSIVAWAKSFPGVPALSEDALFVECNGQVLDDPTSLLDGQTIPNLNASRFIRGAVTSGGTGGMGEHNHTNNYSFNAGAGGTQVPLADSINNSSHIPPYYDVVWLIRVK